MKKFILPLLALAGMVLGFSLTSCGGGGGTGIVSGTRITANGPISAYDLLISDRFGEQGAYTGVLSDHQGNRKTDILIALRNVKTDDKGLLSYAEGTISAVSLDASYRQAMFLIVMGLDVTDSNISNFQMMDAPAFVFNGEDRAASTIQWTASAEYDQVLDNSVEDMTNDTLRTDNVLEVERF